MLGKIIGGIIGARAARGTRGVDEPGGAIMGVAAVALARRFGLPGMIAAAAGGYALKRYNERRRVTPGNASYKRGPGNL
ncbi:hypothetical protein HNO88_001615 [Novosphingobium chloroacetimidivorans]|uniref:Uncharacterized protein n=1 Tax=Novosphingobium chloroacetimidivorans TaxID=1428314 RepID=A0A7W7K8S0_9SPHN|nr:hypothetical protein [Novosphingobium chloroacetimidivorans]MBB4858296.1 hypothetical protein [Novosphingobium chloroacetimidivorans]